MACRKDPSEAAEDLPLVADLSPSQVSSERKKMDYDFVEEPSQDFFCPVTLELLTDPHLTMCCGNHLSQEAASRLTREGKPCPMCKETQLNAVPNKHFKRKVIEIKVYCPHKKSDCEWEGEVSEVIKHSDSCPKRPFLCQYCEFESTHDIGMNEHVPVCTKYPIECPNCCEVGSVARCDVESHLMVCPLQPVTCEYAEVGCDVKVPRRDLDHHMKEGQQHHLMRATLLILRLTRENAEEKNRLLRMIEEKDKQTIDKDQQIKEKDQQLKKKDEAIANLQKQQQEKEFSLSEKDKQITGYEAKLALRDQQLKQKDEMIADLQKQLKQDQDLAQLRDKQITEYETKLAVRDQQLKEKDELITDLQKQLKQVQDGLEVKVTDLKQQVVKYGENTQERMKQQEESMIFGQLNQTYIQQRFSVHKFILIQFKKCQANGGAGDWYSEPFYSHPGGYKFQLDFETNTMNVWFKLLPGDHDDKLDWPVYTIAHVQLLNQLGDHSHIEKTSTAKWKKTTSGNFFRGKINKFLQLHDLGFNVEKNTQYLKDDCLKFRVYFKAGKIDFSP